ncbi:MAG: prolipoprotein diacylglyceryl transferase, partial [Bacteroidales bacterium]
VVLLLLYKFYLDKIKRGLLIGIFFIGIFGSRFFIEFIKENQVSFEQGMVLDMGQWLSIPFVLLGIYLIIRSFIVKTPATIVVPTVVSKDKRK